MLRSKESKRRARWPAVLALQLSLFLLSGASSSSAQCIEGSTGGQFVRTLAGSGTEGSQDGAAGSARFQHPKGVTLTPDGSKAVVADARNNKIRFVDMTSGAVSTLAGSSEGLQDGSTHSPSGVLYGPAGVAVTPDGSKTVVADTYNNKICLIDMATGSVSTLAGPGDRTQGSQDGSASNARFFYPSGVAVTPDGSKAVVADSRNNKIRLVDMATGAVSTLAGSGSYGFQDGSAGSAMFSDPTGIAVTPDGSKAVVADSANHIIRLVNMATGTVSTLAGSSNWGFQDGSGGSARFRFPKGLAMTPDGTQAVVTDQDNNKIRLVNMATGRVSTLAGPENNGQGFQDGAVGSARFYNPYSVVVTPDGSKAVVTDNNNHKIRLVDLLPTCVVCEVLLSKYFGPCWRLR